MPLFVRHLVQHRVAIDPGVVHENIQPAVTLVDVLHKDIAFTGLRHVQAHGEAGWAETRRDRRCVSLVDVSAHDGGTVLGQPADVAAVVAFLASDEAGYITGEVINVGGGYVL